ncbi:hypothetical protein [Mangrovicoccus sp. HB161399]|uniref:hypothetical protein n=1 Tax=Mangrovicoccus sp. HB161399 TaxID=2720392 RepID=UPI0015550311|nr:hypothetical protein [Mangrovicoccus sp. HB161399]
MLEENRPPADLARELGANGCLVREWLKEDRLRRAPARSPAAGFAEVVVQDDRAPAPGAAGEAENACAPACTICISIGDARMELPSDRDEETLSKAFRALRAA